MNPATTSNAMAPTGLPNRAIIGDNRAGNRAHSLYFLRFLVPVCILTVWYFLEKALTFSMLWLFTVLNVDLFVDANVWTFWLKAKRNVVFIFFGQNNFYVSRGRCGAGGVARGNPETHLKKPPGIRFLFALCFWAILACFWAILAQYRHLHKWY